MSECPPRPVKRNFVVEALRAQLAVLDEEYNQNRKALLDAIKQHGGEPVQETRDLPGLNGTQDSIELKIRSVADAVKEARSHFNGEVQLADVRSYIKANFPHIYHSKDLKTINARIWEQFQEEEYWELVSPGRGGKPGIYRRKNGSND